MIFVWKVESGFFSIQFFFRDPKLGKSGSSGPGQFGDISPFQGHVGSTDVNVCQGVKTFRKHTEVSFRLVGWFRQDRAGVVRVGNRDMYLIPPAKVKASDQWHGF